jgi:hypothetical protein
MGIASASVCVCFGSKEALFRQTVALYRTTSEARVPPIRADPCTTTSLAITDQCPEAVSVGFPG